MDASTAISDGCDGIILGCETAQGHYPVEAVRQFLRISSEAERCFDYDSHLARMQVTCQPAIPHHNLHSQRLNSMPQSISCQVQCCAFSKTHSLGKTNKSMLPRHQDLPC